ncbi:3D domain-containing protein [Peribacillus butanolivorans]|uniref:3D domain-containing protein n=1 Tax=Peribacillus butanolivorans TaxID=421767 RepID=UPI0013C2CC40|nr:3D domain-containing protein [Peribacillus butanolivorans]
MALAHYLLLSELQEKAEAAKAPEPYVITVGESEYEKAERLRKVEAEAKRKREAEEAKKNDRIRGNTRDSELRSTNGANSVRHNDVVRWITFEATAYQAFCNTGCTGVTKTGLDVSNTTQHEGRTIIAVDPAVIPLGSKVSIRLADGRVIEGTAQDTGGDIRGHRIDVLVGSEGQAREFGRQSVKARILGK